MRRTNTISQPGAQNGSQATAANDGATKGRYKPVGLTPRHGMPTSSSKLSSGYLRSFGFASTISSSQPETSISEPMQDSTQQAAVSDNQDLWTLDSCLPPPPTVPPPPPPQQEENAQGEKYSVLSESRLNVLSYNLSEIADRISPTKYDPGTEIDSTYLETLMDDDVGSSPDAILPSNDEQPTRFKTPYSRQRRGSKTFVSKQKSFTRRRSRVHHDSQQELNNNGEISFDASNVLSFPAGNSEVYKQDSESDSGYSSSMSASISLSEEVEPSKRPSVENGSGTDIEADDFTSSGEECVKKSSVGSTVTNESVVGELSHQNAGNVEERLDTSIHGVSSGVSELSLNGNWCSETDVQRDAVPNGLDELSPSFKLSHKNSITVDENTKGASDSLTTKSAFHLQKASLDDTNLPSKNGKRPGLLRRRTTVVSFRPPKQMTVQEGESDIVEMDEAGFLQMLTDLKSFKTQLLKLKRELQEADVVSPLMHSHSWAVRRGSLSGETDLLERNSVHKKRMTLHRNMTMDATTMQQRLHRTSSSSSSTGGLVANLDDIVEQTESSAPRNPILQSTAGDNEQVNNLREQLEDMKQKLITITEERNSLVIAREELEHELDSKNHTIRMLQKQLESQTDSQDEMAYLKRQVQSLTNQIQQQQQKITELRYRTSSPGSGPMGAISKETVKADIRNRLRDAFVKHLGESSKSTVQLSKFIQKAEQSISMAQKGLSSLYSSPHASTELLPKDKPRPSFQRSDSQSSAERGQEDSDGRESESDVSKSARWKIASSCVSEDSGSEAGKPVRRRPASLNTSRSEDEADRAGASDSDCGKSRRQRVASPSFDTDNEDANNTRLERDSAKIGVQVEVSDTDKSSKPTVTTPRIRKLSRSKLLSKIEASPLSHSWTPGAIEKIVKSWRETKSPATSQRKTKEEEKSTLKPVSHVQFL